MRENWTLPELSKSLLIAAQLRIHDVAPVYVLVLQLQVHDGGISPRSQVQPK